jgi:hypothetical protein
MGTVIGLSLAVAVASDRRPAASMLVGAATFVGGLILVLAVVFAAGPNNLPPMQMTHLPGVIATLAVTVAGSRGNPRRWLMRRRAPAVNDIRRGAALVVIVSVGLALAPVVRAPLEPAPVSIGPQETSTSGVTPPAGWSVTDTTTYAWAPRYFGPDASLVRQKMTAHYANPDWDPQGRPRTVAVDTLRSADRYQARTFGNETLYSTVNGRRSEPLVVDLGHGVEATAYTILDETDFLTYTKLTFSWTREKGVVEKVSVIAVDDHRPEARFPELAPSISRLLTQVATILFRGNSVTVDTDTRFTDLDVVTEVARGIVDAEKEW